MISRPFPQRRLPVVSPLLALLLLMTMQALAVTNPYRWYYHDTTKNETSAALKAAVQNKCGLLVFVGKPGCHICDSVWSSSYEGTAMMDGTGKMATYLKNNKLVGLKIEDSQSHFSDLASGAMGYSNSDGSKTNTNAPFLVLVKVKEGKEDDTNFDLASRKSDIEIFFGGYGSLGMYDKTYAKITAWVNGLIASDKYKTACPGVSEPVDEDDGGESGSGSGSTSTDPSNATNPSSETDPGSGSGTGSGSTSKETTAVTNTGSATTQPQASADAARTSRTTAATADPQAPAMGDGFALGGWLSLLLTSAAAAFLLMRRRKS